MMENIPENIKEIINDICDEENNVKGFSFE